MPIQKGRGGRRDRRGLTDMLHTDQTRSVTEETDTTALSVRVRLGIENSEYRVLELTARGFAIPLATPMPAGTRLHVSFRLRAGLSISLEAAARAHEASSNAQWFDFVGVDRDVLNLLLSRDAWVVH
jgi:hypothetical protein